MKLFTRNSHNHTTTAAKSVSFFLHLSSQYFLFDRAPNTKCVIRHCVTQTKQQETSDRTNVGAKHSFTLMRKCLHFDATAFANIHHCLGGPYKDCRAQNNRIKSHGVLRNVTTCMTKSDNYVCILVLLLYYLELYLGM